MTALSRGANEHFGQRFHPRFVEWVEVFDLDNDGMKTLRPLQPLEGEATIWCPSDHGRSTACGWIGDTVILHPMECASADTAESELFAEEGTDDGDDVEDEDLSGLADLSKLFETVERRREKRGATPHLNRDPPAQLPSPSCSPMWVKRVYGVAEAETPAS